MTLFTFNDTIPNSGNNPSADQPIMLANNVASQGIIAVDHVGYNTTNGGQHTAITFNQDASYVPSGTVTPPKLFTNTVSGLAQLFFYSGTAAQGANQYSIGANFSTFLLGGMILKGGIITVTTALTQTFTYSTLSPALDSFINNTLSVFITPLSAVSAVRVPYIASVNSTSFTLTFLLAPTSGSQYYFLAIGY